MGPTRDPIAFFAYVSFFPQLVAGPIERATNLLPQFQRARQFDYGMAVDGVRQMLWGFFKKIVVADNCAVYVNDIWNNINGESSLNLAMAAALFSIQIYCDFSGYSDIAIGCAKLFGIKLMHNFKVPYFSRDIAEFWRRWHISLTTWFRGGAQHIHHLLNQRPLAWSQLDIYPLGRFPCLVVPAADSAREEQETH